VPRTVTLKPGLVDVVLPNGYRYKGGDVVTLTDSEYGRLSTTAPGNLFSANGYTPPGSTWRRRDLPDAGQSDVLFSGAAPTISTAQTTTPTTGYIKYAPSGVALAGSDVTGKFTYMGAGAFQIGAGAPDTSYVLPTSKYPNTYTSGQATWAVEFATDAQIIQLRFKYISAATMYRLSINGQRVTDLMQLSGGTTAGSGHLITIDFGSAGPRHLRFDFTTMPFGGIYIPPTAALWAVPSRTDRSMVLGDSLSDGSTMNTGAGAGTWFFRAMRLLGMTDAWEQGRGGTGYITPGTTAVLQDRFALDVLPYNPAKLFVWAGYNDNGGSQTAIATAASTLYTSIKAGLPTTQVFVLGCWSPTGSPAASITTTDATLRTAAAAAGFAFISPTTGNIYDTSGGLVTSHGPFITGTGKAGATTGNGNADLYIGTDGVHPTDAGHIYLARRIAASVRELLPA
jgi:lysophospholipase L1-like esterase